MIPTEPLSTEVLARNGLPALGVNLLFAALGYASRGVRPSGVVGGLLVGVPIYLFLGWQGFLILLVFFVIGTALTRFGYERKLRMGAAEARKGARGMSHALANVGIAAICAAGAWVSGGGLWTVAFAGALATAAMDTTGSEIGPLWGRRTVSLRDFRAVPPGTEGAVSLEGTLAGVGAAAIVALAAWSAGLSGAAGAWAVVPGAILGNLYEGILGSRRLLPHGWLNATNTLVGGAGAAAVAALLLRG
jgi:uncharacterized protein (TIGR00297 family)